MRLVTVVPRVVFGLLFVWAGAVKIADPHAFAETVFNYQILPDVLVNPVALYLPWLEAVCGLFLVVGAFTRGAALVLCTLMLVFLAALGYNFHRGLDVACGCFSAGGGESDLAANILRDVTILLLGLLVLAREVRVTRTAPPELQP